MPTPSWTRTEWFEWIVDTPAKIFITVILAVVIRWLLHRVIDRVVRPAKLGKVPPSLASSRAASVLKEISPLSRERRELRAKTVGSLLKSITSITVFGIAAVMVLDIVGLPIAPLLTGAGVAGVAIGFGAQTLVKDFLSGIFMLLEDQYGVGDTIDVGHASGTVEAVGLRVTQLRDSSGTVWYVRNGEITRVGNHSQQWSKAVLDVTVTQPEDLERAQEALREELEALTSDAQYADLVLEKPEVFGLERYDSSGAVIRSVIKTRPRQHTSLNRALHARVLRRFARENIAITSIESPGAHK